MEALGPVLIVIAIPLALRWIPLNYLYGFRVPQTLRNESVWYDVNARAGKQMVILGAVMVALELVLSQPLRRPILWWIGLAGLAVIVLVNWVWAIRLEHERRG